MHVRLYEWSLSAHFYHARAETVNTFSDWQWQLSVCGDQAVHRKEGSITSVPAA